MEVNTSLHVTYTVSCKLVEVFAMICAVLLQNQAQDSVVALNPAFSVTHVESPRYGGLQSILKRLKTRRRENECQ